MTPWLKVGSDLRSCNRVGFIPVSAWLKVFPQHWIEMSACWNEARIPLVTGLVSVDILPGIFTV